MVFINQLLIVKILRKIRKGEKGNCVCNMVNEG